MEKTLVLLKPDAVVRGLVGTIVARFEAKGLRLVAIKMLKLDDSILGEHYSHLSHKPFFNGIRQFMKSAPVVATCWEGLDAVDTVRKMCGVTNGRQADVGTIRGDFSMSMQTNLVHASDSKESASTELNRFFTVEDFCPYETPSLDFLYSNDERGNA